LIYLPGDYGIMGLWDHANANRVVGTGAGGAVGYVYVEYTGGGSGGAIARDSNVEIRACTSFKLRCVHQYNAHDHAPEITTEAAKSA
jgi:hypothetical protein